MVIVSTMFLQIFFLVSFFSSSFLQSNFLTQSWQDFKAFSASRLGKHDQAQALYAQTLDQNPYDPYANYNIGVTLAQQKKITGFNSLF